VTERDFERARRPEVRRPFDVENRSAGAREPVSLAEDDHVLLVVMHQSFVMPDARALDARLGCSIAPARPVTHRPARLPCNMRTMPNGNESAPGRPASRLRSTTGTGARGRVDASSCRRTAPDQTCVRRAEGAWCWSLPVALATTRARWRRRRERHALHDAPRVFRGDSCSRYSGQSDIVVGSPMIVRNRRSSRGMAGMFVNMLALRT